MRSSWIRQYSQRIKMPGVSGRMLCGIAIPVGVVLIWEIAVVVCVAVGVKSTAFIVIPKPSTILNAVRILITDPVTIKGVAVTLFSASLGFSLGILLSVILGTLLGLSRRASLLFEPTLNFFRVLPVALYVPIALAVVGSDLRLPILLSGLVSTLYGIIPVIRAVRDYDDEKWRFLNARVDSHVTLLLRFVIPEIAGSLHTSVSIAATLSLGVTVVSEMLLQNLGGIGSLVIAAKEASQYSNLWAFTAILGICGFCFCYFLNLIWHLVFPWVNSRSKK